MKDIITNLLGETVEWGFRQRYHDSSFEEVVEGRGFVRGAYVDHGLAVIVEIIETFRTSTGEQPGDLTWVYTDSNKFIRIKRPRGT